ncbi:MAG TPA: hypothetical protein VI479_14680 [Blastocatellia bacterium]
MFSLRTLFQIVAAWLAGFSLVSLAYHTEVQAYPQAIRQEKEKKMNKSVTSESPIACNMSALDREQRRRHQSLTKQLRAATQETRERPEGYSFRLPSDETTIQRAVEWITLERRCCPFIAFGIEVGREGGPLWLSLTGREGVKPFLKMEFGLK